MAIYTDLYKTLINLKLDEHHVIVQYILLLPFAYKCVNICFVQIILCCLLATIPLSDKYLSIGVLG